MKGFGWVKKLNPVDALAKRAGRKAVEGAIEAITPPQQKGTGSMFGVNKTTTGAGWAVIIWQIVQVIVPILLPQLAGVQVSAETNAAVTGAIVGAGLLGAKDAKVTGVGSNARRE